MTNTIHKCVKGLCWILLLVLCRMADAQDTTAMFSQDQDSSRIIHLLNADVLLGIQPKGNDSSQYQKLIGNVRLRQGQTVFTCDSALQNLTHNTIDAYGHIHINQADTINTYSDFLHYVGDTKIATLRKNVRMTDGQMTLTTNLLNYDMNAHIGNYMSGGKLVNQGTVLTSERGYYYADTRDVYFKTNVQLTDPEYTLATDTLLYNTITRIATFEAPTTINTGKSIIHTSCGYYSTVENYAHLCNRSAIIDSSQRLTADSMNYTKSTGIGKAYGNVVWTDTARKITMLSNYAVSDQNKKTVMATQKPLMILVRKADSLYVAADTFFSGPLIIPPDTVPHPGPAAGDSIAIAADSLQKIKDRHDSTGTRTDTSLRYIIAYHHVRLFSDSLQGVSDSLYYSDSDSAFHFYKDPVLWTGVTQLTGDTIVLTTKNQQASRLLLQQHGMIINQTGPGIYNQIKGTNITGFFGEDNQLQWMAVDGNAESLYYAQDDSGAFVGGNRTTSAKIHLYFKDSKLNQVVFLKDIDGTFTPPTQISEEDKKLKGFRWEQDLRPASKTDLMQ